jgi:hypothetical protein
MASMMFGKKKKAQAAAKVAKPVTAKKPSEDRTRTVTTTTQTSAGKKGAMYVEEGTVQRSKTGGVNYIPKASQKPIENAKGKIVDPKSGKTEKSSQENLRKVALDSHKGVDLSKRYKEGDLVTYDTKKGKQVAGKVKKEADTPPTYKTETSKEYKAEKIHTVNKVGGKMIGNTHVGGKTVAGNKKSKFIPEKDLKQGTSQKGGYVVENEAKQKKLVKGKDSKFTKASGSKSMKLGRK